jgi:hypothetical protein
MALSKIGDAEFIELFTKLGATEFSKQSGISERNIYARRKRIEDRTGKTLSAPTKIDWEPKYQIRIHEKIINGTVFVASDCHYWPGVITTAHRGFVKLIKREQPTHIVMNGDVYDGSTTGRHDRIMWDSAPSVKEELEAVGDRLHEIIKASPKSKRFWLLGNHDSRLETYLSKNAPALEGMEGTMLKHHFPAWDFAWALWINNSAVIKHRYKGGDHATHNNTVRSGKTMVTGHLHSLKVTPYTDYTGLRFGVDTGTLTEPAGINPGGPQTAYNEDNPQNHRSGFIVLTFKDGVLLWPEIAYVLDQDHICFRGEVIKV